ncbi:probable dolichol-phosphate mannosyltransferase subunit 3 isoform X1 [Pieris rapae]|uniref:probable dolichol-phosphate mannosyltransferase subunit 3 isoform X1 n=2 Tax=Pieris rapae TaxID=64459 RepID=UPI001E27BF83|nr:probable dolichol-phosphate mannosyltransferase subunit 3 isoform X1 [Pieris rapae]
MFKKICLFQRIMTKLLEWVSAASAFFAIWYSLIGGYVKHPIIENNMDLILISPIIFLILFGVYAVTVVLYRVFTFNNCEAAFLELQKQIKEANTELTAKGLKW